VLALADPFGQTCSQYTKDPAVSWLPFYPVKKLTPAGEHVYVSKFVLSSTKPRASSRCAGNPFSMCLVAEVGADKELFLIINTGTETAGTQDRELHVRRIGMAWERHGKV